MTIPYKKILLPLDGSDFSAQALPHAELIASAHGAELILFEVVEDQGELRLSFPGIGAAGEPDAAAVGIGPVRSSEETHQEAMDQAKRSLDELATSLQHRKINAVADIDTGDPATCIVDYVTEQDVDLVVMNTHGRTGIQRWTYGSVTTKVLQAAPCAILVVRPT